MQQAMKAKKQSESKIKKTPDPKLHQVVSFVKSAVRIAACVWGMLGLFEIGFTVLLLAEVIGIIEELV